MYDEGFDSDLSVARVCAVFLCEMSWLGAADVMITLRKMLVQHRERVWSLTLFCLGVNNARARDVCMCAWLLTSDGCSHTALVRENGWSESCERILLELQESNDESAEEGFARLAVLLYEREGALERAAAIFEKHCNLSSSVLARTHYATLQVLRGRVLEAQVSRKVFSPQLFFPDIKKLTKRIAEELGADGELQPHLLVQAQVLKILFNTLFDF